MKNSKFILSALFMFLVTALSEAAITTGTLAGVYVKNPPTLIIDDWDDGVPPNNLGAGGGSLTGGGGIAKEVIVSTVALGGTGCALQINYDVSAQESAFSGYWSRFHHTYTKDLSDYNCLSFYVKGESGGEFFKIELSTGDGGWKSRIYINDYLDGGVSSTTWKKVVIPFDNFANVTDWTKIYEFTIVFEGWAAQLNDSPTSGTIYVDNLVVSSNSQEIVRLDHFGDKIGVNSTGGDMGDGSGGGGSCNHVFVSTQFFTSPNSLEINYNVFTFNDWAGVFSIVGGGADGWEEVSHDFSDYDQMSFYVKAKSADENPEKMKIELKCIGNSIVPVWIENIPTSWKEYKIPFSSFTGLDIADYKIDEWVFVFDNSSSTSKIGTVYIDDVQFEDSFYVGDSTYPATPENLRLMDTATGTLVTPNMEFGWINWLTVEADNGIDDPTLESVSFEYHDGSKWVTIGYDYDVSDKIYSAYWDTTGLAESPPTYELRAVARDTSGNKSEMTAKTITVKHYPDDISAMIDDDLLELIQRQIFWYFWTEINPEKGLVQDRARNFDQDDYGYTSVAATGLGLVSICIAHQRGWVNFTDAYNRVCNILKNYFNAPESSNPSDPMLVHHYGFFYHYTNFGGARTGGELSTIDTAIFAAGALYAGKYFENFGYHAPWDYADQIYKRIDWDWMRNGDDYLDWGWTPEGGFNQGEMAGYSECILAYILGIGSPESGKKLPDASGWNNLSRPVTTYRGLGYVFEKALFTHQYPLLFINFKGKRDNHACYAANTFKATIHHHRYCYDNQDNYSTYSENSWGLGGSDGPYGYYAYGVGDDNGTVALSNLITAIKECPQQVIKAIRHLYNTHGSKLWGKYIFCDSYNTDDAHSGEFNEDGMWRTPDVLGVQQGAVMLAIENYRTNNSIQNTFTDIDYIQAALDEIGFTDDDTPPGKITDLQASILDNQVVLNWTAPGNDGDTGDISDGIYEIRFSTDPDDDWEAAPDNYLNYNIIWSTDVVAITSQSRIVHGLPGNLTYYFRIKTADDSFNWSIVSDTNSVYVPEDVTAPSQITNLETEPAGGIVMLKWTAPGDDGDTGNIYNGKYNVVFTTEVAHGPGDAPYSEMWGMNTSPGNIENRIVSGNLVPMTSHYFWIRAADESLNWSVFSNTVTFYVVDPISPSAITDLSASLDFQVKLTWTAPGDDGITGAATKYIIKYSSNANITTEFWWQQAKLYGEFSGPQSAGNTETKTLTGFAPDVNYWFAVRAVDDKDNMGNISNTTGNNTAAGYFALSQSLGGTAFAFGDMDNDGNLDLAISGSYWTNIYRNDEGLLNSVQVVERGGSSVRWLDFDKDGFLDFVVIPGRPVSPTWDYQAHLYKNNSGTSFTCTQSFLRYDNAASGLDVADYDNDGDIDIALTGWGGGEKTHIWRNDNGSFTNMYGCGLPGKQFSNVSFGDYNNDGWMDISLKGRIYKNDGDGTFSDSTYGGYRDNPSLAWGDIDNDGDLDYAIGAGDPSHVLPNNGDGTFDEAILTHNDAGNKAAFGDYNNDGNIDLLFGNKLYTNMGGGEFWEKHAVSAGRRAAWGDIDNDGDLDFVDSSGLYKNMLADYGVVNSTPFAPTELSAGVYGSSITFMWDVGSDTETPSAGLYYSMRVGTMPYNNPGDDNIIAGRFGTPLLGNHLRPKISNIQLGRYVKNLAEGNTYYWSIQTIDAGLCQSPWSEEQNACIPKISPAPLNDLSATDAGDSGTSARAKLTWTATGDDGSIRDITDGKYLIKYSSDSIDTWENMTYELEWSTNTSPGNNESKIITGLLSSTTYYFYIKLRDEINDNWSELSNKATCYVEIMLPAPITDLSAADIGLGDQSILTWTATGDDGSAGDIVGGEYWVKYSSQSTDLWDDMPYEIKWPTNTSPGNNESRVITGLLSSTTYYFYIRLRDDVNNNWSGLSNKTTCEVLTDITPPAPTNNLSADRANTIEGQLRLSWTATGDNGNNDILVDGSKFAVLRSSYIVTWSTTNAQVIISTSNVNPGDNQIYVLTGLVPGSTYYCKLWTCDELQNWSSISNGATTWAQIDVTAPAAITNLTALVDGSLSAGEIKLQWSAPGDDIWDGTAASYEIRYASTTPPFFESFEDNNMDGWETGGGANWYVIKNGWIPAMFNNHYANSGEYSAWCEYNGTDNWSWIKRTVTGPYTFSFWWKTYKPNTSKFKVDGVDIISPGRVNGWDWEKQTYELSPGTHTVEWSFKLDNGFISIDDIDIRGNIWKSSRPVGGPAGFNEIETITGLTQGATYYFRIWTADEALNWSGLSNGATEQAKE